MVFGIIPECRSDSYRNERSASPESSHRLALSQLRNRNAKRRCRFPEIDVTRDKVVFGMGELTVSQCSEPVKDRLTGGAKFGEGRGNPVLDFGKGLVEAYGHLGSRETIETG